MVEQEAQDVPAGESAFETAARLIGESEDGTEAEASPAQGNEEPVQGSQQDDTQAQEQDKDSDIIEAKPGRPRKDDVIEPPDYLTVEDKEEFLKMPRAGRRILKNQLTKVSREFTKFAQRTSEAERKAAQYDQYINGYLQQQPKLVEKGYTGPKLVHELLGTHMTLVGPDRRAAWNRFAELGADLGFDIRGSTPQQFQQGDMQGQGQQQYPDFTSSPQWQAVQEQLNQVNSYVQQQQALDHQDQFADANQALSALRNERTADGRYVYPHLHDNAFTQRIEQLALDLGGTSGDWPTAIKKAYETYGGTVVEGQQQHSPQNNQAGLPGNNQQINRQAAQAAVSVRGAQAPQQANGAFDVPKEHLKDPFATAAYIVQQGGS